MQETSSIAMPHAHYISFMRAKFRTKISIDFEHLTLSSIYLLLTETVEYNMETLKSIILR